MNTCNYFQLRKQWQFKQNDSNLQRTNPFQSQQSTGNVFNTQKSNIFNNTSQDQMNQKQQQKEFFPNLQPGNQYPFQKTFQEEYKDEQQQQTEYFSSDEVNSGDSEVIEDKQQESINLDHLVTEDSRKQFQNKYMKFKIEQGTQTYQKIHKYEKETQTYQQKVDKCSQTIEQLDKEAVMGLNQKNKDDLQKIYEEYEQQLENICIKIQEDNFNETIANQKELFEEKNQNKDLSLKLNEMKQNNQDQSKQIEEQKELIECLKIQIQCLEGQKQYEVQLIQQNFTTPQRNVNVDLNNNQTPQTDEITSVLSKDTFYLEEPRPVENYYTQESPDSLHEKIVNESVLDLNINDELVDIQSEIISQNIDNSTHSPQHFLNIYKQVEENQQQYKQQHQSIESLKQGYQKQVELIKYNIEQEKDSLYEQIDNLRQELINSYQEKDIYEGIVQRLSEQIQFQKDEMKQYKDQLEDIQKYLVSIYKLSLKCQENWGLKKNIYNIFRLIDQINGQNENDLKNSGLIHEELDQQIFGHFTKIQTEKIKSPVKQSQPKSNLNLIRKFPQRKSMNLKIDIPYEQKFTSKSQQIDVNELRRLLYNNSNSPNAQKINIKPVPQPQNSMKMSQHKKSQSLMNDCDVNLQKSFSPQQSKYALKKCINITRPHINIIDDINLVISEKDSCSSKYSNDSQQNPIEDQQQSKVFRKSNKNIKFACELSGSKLYENMKSNQKSQEMNTIKRQEKENDVNNYCTQRMKAVKQSRYDKPVSSFSEHQFQQRSMEKNYNLFKNIY